jgi:predicted nucleotide-binding protein
MPLPIRTTLQDIKALCGYLITKPTGATVTEAKAVLDTKVLDGRKISALKFWGLLEDEGGKLKITEHGRLVAKDKGVRFAEALRQVVKTVPPYLAMIERAIHKNEYTIATTDVAAHWHQHFREQSSDSDKILNDQANCFFQIAEGADLGRLIVGRKGGQTRFDFDQNNCEALMSGSSFQKLDSAINPNDTSGADSDPDPEAGKVSQPAAHVESFEKPRSNKVFITHGKNGKILQQVKEIVAFGKFEPVVAQERESTAVPVPEKVMDAMRGCSAAVIHVGIDHVLYDSDKKEHPQINGNVLIEIGAAMALYGRNFILLVEEGLKLPSNLQGLYECRYTGDELNMPATMKLLKTFNEFT